MDQNARIQVPDWEVYNAKSRSNFLDRIYPPYKTYFGMNRKKILIITGVVVAIILALAIGLGVGLSKHGNKSKSLPLPTDSQTFTGDWTYYGPGLGACGVTSTDEDNIVSISHFLFDAYQVGGNPNTNPLCGLKLRATRFNERVNEMRSVDLTVVDRCTGCLPTDLDTSTAAFDQLAPHESGRVKVNWAWLTPPPPQPA